ncbi:hypothetical protein EHS25_006665 [Saitozyma podzolica]|uniref:Uncharacterized protein n=1 Tax=Saitozyma podzolica TaxID=1890683 RepID=A0A427YSF3_9TREE|nr:hypothetical protein EHS25_006665 [Saitozyma podzolica]
MPDDTYTGPINPDPQPGEADVELYGYVPSAVLGVVGVLVFLIVLSINTFRWFKNRKTGTLSFYFFLAFGALLEAAGYGCRIASHNNPYKTDIFIVEFFLVTCAPIAFAASIYLNLTFATKKYPLGRSLLWLNPRWVLIIFIAFDLCTTVVQITGAGIVGISTSKSLSGESVSVSPQTGNSILEAGLAVQITSFGCFLILLTIAITRIPRLGGIPPVVDAEVKKWATTNCRKLLGITMFAALLILLRTSYRLACQVQGYFGYLNTHEYLFGLLDFTPVAIATLTLSFFPPSNV